MKEHEIDAEIVPSAVFQPPQQRHRTWDVRLEIEGQFSI